MARKMNATSTSTLQTGFSIKSRVVMCVVLASALLAACGVWAARAQLTGAVIAHGSVTVRSQVKEIQHRDGGIVGEILVEDGQHVEAGDVLIRLDDTQLRAELGILESQLWQLTGRRARLIAERNGAAEIDFEPGFLTATATADIAEGEQRLFQRDREMRDVQREQLGLQVAQLTEQVHGLESQRAANEIERGIIAVDDDRAHSLVGKGLIEVSKVSTIDRDMAKIDGLSGEIASNIARVNGQISEAKLRILELDNQTRAHAQQELRDVEAKLDELKERLIASKDRLTRTDLRAPISGTVNHVSVHTINGVIAPGATVMTVVPDGELVVEARVQTTDVDQLQIGQSVKLRFSAFNQRTTPELSGTVRVIGAAPVLDPATGAPYYLSSIAINDASTALGDKTLVPGMPVEVFFQTGERSALSYLVKPFVDQMNRAFREE
jgi:HlyD family type I secretion membrane fusion protein